MPDFGKPLEIPFAGQEMYDLAAEIFPIFRSLTGEGVRKTLGVLNDYVSRDGIHLKIHEVPSGTQVFDWTVPKEWRIRSAYIEDRQGNRIVDMEENNLHVLGYSVPVDRWVSLEELKKVVREAAKLRRRRTAMTCFSDEQELV